MNKQVYKNLVAFHPGSYIKDIIDDMEMTQSEFAKRLNTTDKTLSKLINGEIPLSNDLAKNLSQMLGTSIDVWLNLQKNYVKKCYEIKQEKENDEEKKYLSNIDYDYLSSLNLLPKTVDKIEQVNNLRQYFKISTLAVLKKPDLLVACRTAIQKIEDKNIINANIWIQTGINIAKEIDCANFNKKRLEANLNTLRLMTCQPAEEFYPQLKKVMSSCGVALVALPYLKHSGLNGAVKWINKNKVLLLINDRRKDAGSFWFSLFHEIGHILQEKKKQVYLTKRDKTGVSLGCDDIQSEWAADDFANKQLIPHEKYQSFIVKGIFSKEDIITFSQDINISPAIVLGRLQHDRYLPWNAYKELKIQYVICNGKST